jgi:aspartyl-tRNA(Asn)/glutamyl-tRNA(Gln) amidotransferase subunit C
MEVTDELVDHLANLSQLEFVGEDKQKAKADLVRILAFVDKLSELDTTGVEPLRHMTTGQNAWREDMPGLPMDQAEALAPASSAHPGYFTVPKFIQK